ncbi:unnamed protein product [marine sediment metagenome]|uniref:Uncharacterized protein n=1 Tax=marine sediment metagenome TaxID=412755 RepID=X0XHU2_9ZZZZ
MATIQERILEADDLPREKVHVPEWNMDVWIRSLTAAERDDYEQGLLRASGQGRSLTMTPNLANAKAKLVVRTLVYENGERMFTDVEAGKLGQKSARAINRLYDVAERLSGISEEDIEELVKNSDSGPGEPSPSD